MIMEYITFVGFVFEVFCAGVAVGKIMEKIERHIHLVEGEDHERTYKNERR